MSASNSVITPANIQLTPCRVTFNGVDLGGTEGGVTINPKYKISDITVDQYGDTVVDGVVSGQHYNTKFVLAESKFLPNWKVAFPHAKLLTGNTNVYFDMQIGDKLSNHAFPLILHPLSNVDADLSGDLLCYKAVAMSATEIKFGHDKQIGLSVEMTILPDTSVVPARFVMLGNPANGIVSAIAAAAVAGANTGNGTITGQAPSNQFTKTEVITVLCVGASGGNDFAVSGSVSGALGTFHVGAVAGNTHAFISSPLSFTMTQGATEFAYGDSFTIATTAANYA
jgi:hypothetical protein